MATTIKLKNGSGAPLAGDLVAAEPAFDLTNKRLYTEDSGGTVIEVGTNPGTDVTFADNRKAIFGAGSDLQIYHDGSHSRIDEQGTGVLFLQTNGTNIQLNKGTSENMLVANVDGSVDLYYDGSQKLATTATGIDVTGDVNSDSVTTGTFTSTGIDDNATSTAITIDSSENVGIGATTVDSALHIEKATPRVTLQIAGNSGYNTIESGGVNELIFGRSGTEQMRIDSSGNLLVGTTNVANSATVPGHYILPSGLHTSTRDGGAIRILNRLTSDGDLMIFRRDGTTVGSLSAHGGAVNIGNGIASLAFLPSLNTIHPNGTGSGSDGLTSLGWSNNRFKDLYLSGALTNNGTGGINIDTSGNVGIGTTSPLFKFHVKVATDENIRFSGGSGDTRISAANDANSANTQLSLQGDPLLFRTSGGAEMMRIDSSGNLLVGKTSASTSTVGGEINADGTLVGVRASGNPLLLNRTTTDGAIATFRKDNVTVGSIGNLTSSSLYINGNGSAVADLGFGGTSLIYPTVDNVADLGIATFRFDDIYATNGTIQTSDANEKQDIEALSEAETRVAVAAKALLRKFRWKSAVEEKGDEARIHFGIIAQDLKAAFEAEGLDAGRYAMFIHSTWTDEETGEERSRMGVRYSELLAFIIAAI